MATEELKDNPLASRGPGRPKTKTVAVKPREEKVEAKPVVEEVKLEEIKEIGDDDKVTLSGKELKALRELAASAGVPKPADNDLVNALVTALRESRKPYKSDADIENERRQTEQMRATIRKQLRDAEISRTYCQHMAGTNKLSDVPHPANAFTAIIWHDITPSFRWGICTVCQRQFWPSDTDYRYWRQKRSFNRGSQTGERDGVDIQKWAVDEHPEPFGSLTGVDPADIVRQSYIVF